MGRNRSLGHRIREIRERLYGDDAGPLAAALGLPERTWRHYESGVTMPAVVVLKFIALTGADPRRLLTGDEECPCSRPSPDDHFR